MMIPECYSIGPQRSKSAPKGRAERSDAPHGMMRKPLCQRKGEEDVESTDQYVEWSGAERNGALK